MLNASLEAAARQVMSAPTAAQFRLTMRFFNTNTNSTWSFVPFHISLLRIDRNYLVNWGDVIDLSLMVSPSDYANMQDQGQDLACLITLNYTDLTGKVVYSPPPVQTQYQVVISNPMDIRKSIPNIHQHVEPTMDMTVRLVERSVYNLRHTRINTIFQTMTVTNVTYALAQLFGVTKLHLVPPDNTHSYDHLKIVSYQGMDQVWDYIQQKFGYYTRGLAAYLTGGCLFIYPPYETAPVYDKTAIFYQVEQGQYAGSNIFHQIKGSSISIVVNQPPTSFDLSIHGSENVGTGLVFTRASRMTDGYTSLDSSGVQYTDNPALSITVKNARTAMKDRNNVLHIQPTDNPFPHMSALIAHQASVMEVNWPCADPFQLDPGHAVRYYYDQAGVMVQKTGIVESGVYEIRPVTKLDSGDLFQCQGTLSLRLAPNATQVFSAV